MTLMLPSGIEIGDHVSINGELLGDKLQILFSNNSTLNYSNFSIILDIFLQEKKTICTIIENKNFLTFDKISESDKFATSDHLQAFNLKFYFQQANTKVIWNELTIIEFPTPAQLLLNSLTEILTVGDILSPKIQCIAKEILEQQEELKDKDGVKQENEEDEQVKKDQHVVGENLKEEKKDNVEITQPQEDLDKNEDGKAVHVETDQKPKNESQEQSLESDKIVVGEKHEENVSHEEKVPEVKHENQQNVNHEEKVPEVKHENQQIVNHEEKVPEVKDENQQNVSHKEKVPGEKHENQQTVNPEEKMTDGKHEISQTVSHEKKVPEEKHEYQQILNHEVKVPEEKNEIQQIISHEENVPEEKHENQQIVSPKEKVTDEKHEISQIVSDEEKVPEEKKIDLAFAEAAGEQSNNADGIRTEQKQDDKLNLTATENNKNSEKNPPAEVTAEEEFNEINDKQLTHNLLLTPQQEQTNETEKSIEEAQTEIKTEAVSAPPIVVDEVSAEPEISEVAQEVKQSNIHQDQKEIKTEPKNADENKEEIDDDDKIIDFILGLQNEQKENIEKTQTESVFAEPQKKNIQEIQDNELNVGVFAEEQKEIVKIEGEDIEKFDEEISSEEVLPKVNEDVKSKEDEHKNVGDIPKVHAELPKMMEVAEEQSKKEENVEKMETIKSADDALFKLPEQPKSDEVDKLLVSEDLSFAVPNHEEHKMDEIVKDENKNGQPKIEENLEKHKNLMEKPQEEEIKKKEDVKTEAEKKEKHMNSLKIQPNNNPSAAVVVLPKEESNNKDVVLAPVQVNTVYAELQEAPKYDEIVEEIHNQHKTAEQNVEQKSNEIVEERQQNHQIFSSPPSGDQINEENKLAPLAINVETFDLDDLETSENEIVNELLKCITEAENNDKMSYNKPETVNSAVNVPACKVTTTKDKSTLPRTSLYEEDFENEKINTLDIPSSKTYSIKDTQIHPELNGYKIPDQQQPSSTQFSKNVEESNKSKSLNYPRGNKLGTKITDSRKTEIYSSYSSIPPDFIHSTLPSDKPLPKKLQAGSVLRFSGQIPCLSINKLNFHIYVVNSNEEKLKEKQELIISFSIRALSIKIEIQAIINDKLRKSQEIQYGKIVYSKENYFALSFAIQFYATHLKLILNDKELVNSPHFFNLPAFTHAQWEDIIEDANLSIDKHLKQPITIPLPSALNICHKVRCSFDPENDGSSTLITFHSDSSVEAANSEKLTFELNKDRMTLSAQPKGQSTSLYYLHQIKTIAFEELDGKLLISVNHQQVTSYIHPDNSDILFNQLKFVTIDGDIPIRHVQIKPAIIPQEMNIPCEFTVGKIVRVRGILKENGKEGMLAQLQGEKSSSIIQLVQDDQEMKLVIDKKTTSLPMLGCNDPFQMDIVRFKDDFKIRIWILKNLQEFIKIHEDNADLFIGNNQLVDGIKTFIVAGDLLELKLGCAPYLELPYFNVIPGGGLKKHKSVSFLMGLYLNENTNFRFCLMVGPNEDDSTRSLICELVDHSKTFRITMKNGIARDFPVNYDSNNENEVTFSVMNNDKHISIFVNGDFIAQFDNDSNLPILDHVFINGDIVLKEVTFNTHKRKMRGFSHCRGKSCNVL